MRFQILFGILEALFIFFPKAVPIERKMNWNNATSIGNNNELAPKILLPIPIQNESIDSAIPRYIASLVSILQEKSKSEEIGSLIIWIVIPKNLMKIW